MKFHPLSLACQRSVLLALAAALTFTVGFRSAGAADLFWDQNGAGANTGGTGNWDLSSLFWRNGSDTGTLQPWAGTNNAIFGGTAGTVTLNTTGISADGLSFTTTGYIIAGGPTNVLTLTGSAPTINVTTGTATFSTGVISGTSGFTKTGTGSLVIQSASGISGAVNVNAGTLSLGTSAGALASVTSVSIAQGATLQLNNTSSNNNNNRLGNIDVTLNGGTLNFVGLEATTLANASSESINRVVLSSGASTLSLAGSVNASGANLGTLTLANAASGISRSTGASLNFVDDADGDIISNNLTNTNSIVGGWAVHTGVIASWITSSSGSLRELMSFLQASDSTTWLTTSNVEATGDRSNINTRTINSLAIRSATARTVSINSGQTLNVSSGGLMATGTASHILSWGLISSGTTAGSELFIYNNTGFNVSSIVANNAGGAVSLVKSGTGNLTLSGSSANTFTGTSYINEGTLTMSKTAGVDAVGGNVSINGGTLTYGTSITNQISDLASVVLNSGTFNLSDRIETVGALTMTGGTLTRGGAILALSGASTITSGTLNFTAAASRITAGGSLALGGAVFSYDSSGTPTSIAPTFLLAGDISYASSNVAGTAFLNSSSGIGRLDLGTGTRIFDIADSTTLAAATPEVSVAWTVAGSSTVLRKTGSGELALSAANTYSGGTELNGGSLLIGNANALGTTGTLSFAGGTLKYNGITTDLSIRFSTAASQAYSINTNGVNVPVATALNSSGGTLAKSGAGDLTLSTGNSLGGATTVSGGRLISSGANSLGGTSGITIQTGGTLLLAGATDRINNNAIITLSGGKLDTGGLSEGTSGIGGAGLGALSSSTTTSVIDFGGNVMGSVIAFQSIDSVAGTLSIWNWTGAVDRFFVATGPTTTYNNISFYEGSSGEAIGGGGAQLVSMGENAGFVLTPVPEVGALFGALGLLAPLAYRERRHWMRCREART